MPTTPDRAEQAALSPNLVCLGGRPAPRELLADLRKASSLPDAARQHLWELLGPCLAESNPSDLADRVQRFRAAHGASAEELGDAIGAVRCLIRGASALDMSRASFADDLARLPWTHDLGALLLPGYDAAKAMVRAEIARESVTDHGKMLSGVDWRLDTVASSNRGGNIGVPIALLTLRYRRGKRRGGVTFQASLNGLRELHDTCGRILDEAAKSGRS